MFKRFVVKIFLFFRKVKYSFFSDNTNVNGKHIAHQPVVFKGKGSIVFGNNVNFGVTNSPYFYNSYAYLEARTKESFLKFGNNIHINNGFSIVSEKGITIHDNTLIGFNCHIIDSTFHNLEIDKRRQTDPNPEEVVIGQNVFVGNNVTILKGVTIGTNSIVASGSVVTKSCPKNVIVAGVPATVIKQL